MDLEQIKAKWFGWFHFVYASIVIIAAYKDFWSYDQTFRETVLLIAFSLYFLILLLFLLLFTISYSRKARYSEATKCIHDALHIARDAYHYLDWCISPERPEVHYQKQLFCSYITNLLTAVSKAFTLVTGTNCRASLKVIGQNQDNTLFVTTLARDQVSSHQCQEKDDREATKHLVSKNTDFHLITQGELNYFFHNNLCKYDNYQNTSIDDYTRNMSSKKWPLPYKSTIVWPIRYKRKSDEHDLGKDRQEDMYGFLTVDSSSRDVFSERYDVEMGAAVADSMFSVLDTYSKAVALSKNAKK